VIASIEDIRQRTWDFALTIVTILLLAGLGVQSFVGTIYTWWAIRATPGWERSGGYTLYVDAMNMIAAPMIVVLVVVMGLCVPKRLFARRPLLIVSLIMLIVGMAAGVVANSLATGLTVYLLLSAAIQLAVVIMTIAGVRGPSYLTEGRLTKTGSGLLHLGFIVFAIVVVALQKSTMMAPIFWLSATLVTGGTALSFYASAFTHRLPHSIAEDAEDEFLWDSRPIAEDPAEPADDPPQPLDPADPPAENSGAEL
jgi:hypothetical protein